VNGSSRSTVSGSSGWLLTRSSRPETTRVSYTNRPCGKCGLTSPVCPEMQNVWPSTSVTAPTDDDSVGGGGTVPA
jgi:hypothetical protein